MAEEFKPAPAAPAAAGDPSMEDILASIRRILNEDEPGAASPPSAEPSDATEPLALTEAMLVALPPGVANTPASLPTPNAVAPVVATPPLVQAAAAPGTEAPEPLVSAAHEALLAPAAAAAASAAVGQLLRAVAQDRGASVTRSGGPSIEDVVREELRPLLKDWLDQHLPGLVERLVRSEIERVVGRALS
jgi:uncharacterized protein